MLSLFLSSVSASPNSDPNRQNGTTRAGNVPVCCTAISIAEIMLRKTSTKDWEMWLLASKLLQRRSSTANISGLDSPSRTPVSVSCFGSRAGIKQVVLMLWWIVINGQNKKWLVFGWCKEHKSKLSNVACLVTKAEDESLDFRAAVNVNRSRSSIFSHQLGAGGYLCLSAVTAEA